MTRTHMPRTSIDDWDGQPLWHFEQDDTVIEGVRALCRLGVGLRCESWLAHSRTHGVVTVKLCRPHEVGTAKGVRAMRREADSLRLVQHHAIRPLLAERLDADIPALIFQHAAGSSLSEHLDEATLSPMHALDMVASLVGALAATHRAGLVHLDVKPSNIIVRPNRFDRPMLIDFGSARPNGWDPGPGTPPGSPGYAPPEVERNERITPAVDVYGLGTVLYEAITGEAAFDPDLDAADRPLPPQPSDLADWAPASIDRLVADLLAPDPLDRPHLEQVDRAVGRMRDELDKAAGGWTSRSLQHLWGDR
ncbi:MAG: hypothetical protein RI900_2868 [Actinomycetota bacterium]